MFPIDTLLSKSSRFPETISPSSILLVKLLLLNYQFWKCLKHSGCGDRSSSKIIISFTGKLNDTAYIPSPHIQERSAAHPRSNLPSFKFELISLFASLPLQGEGSRIAIGMIVRVAIAIEVIERYRHLVEIDTWMVSQTHQQKRQISIGQNLGDLCRVELAIPVHLNRGDTWLSSLNDVSTSQDHARCDKEARSMSSFSWYRYPHSTLA